MIIDTNAINRAAQKIIDNVNRREAEDRTKKINLIKTCGAKILASVEVAAAIAPAVAALRKRHLNFITAYYTDGINHQVGFCRFNDNLVGCEGGGCSGRSVFIDVTDKTFLVGSAREENGCDKYTSLDEIAAKYWDNFNVRDKFEKIANELIAFVERAAYDIQSRA